LVALVLAIQLTTALCLRNTHPLSFKFLLCAYAIGGTCNQNIFLAIHEITHNLAFRGLRANKALAVLVNCCIGVPYSMLFKVSRRIEALCSFTLLTLAAAVPH
jgi:sphingolipid delta-4 desaturase